MTKKNLTDFTVGELNKLLKKTKLYHLILMGLIFVMVMLSIITIYKNDVQFVTFMPLFFLPNLYFQQIQIKRIKNEIYSRK